MTDYFEEMLGVITSTATEGIPTTTTFDDILEASKMLDDIAKKEMNGWREFFKDNKFDIDNGDAVFFNKDVGLSVPLQLKDQVIFSSYIEKGSAIFINGDCLTPKPVYGHVKWRI